MGQFLQPDPALEQSDAPHEQVGVKIRSGYQAISEAAPLMGHSAIFDLIAERLQAVEMPYEDQCSIDYYFDLARVLRDFNGEYNRVVEVGVFMGGSSAVIAGCAERFDFDLDLVDNDDRCLLIAYERIRRAFPECVGRVRLWHGDTASYVREVMLNEPPRRTLLHHDGSHNFGQVVSDFSALSFVQDQLLAVIAQDTHLRGSLEMMEFVDLAMVAIFGADMNYMPIGRNYNREDTRTSPDRFRGNYFLPETPEGMVLPMSANAFHYPHPEARFEDLFPAEVSKLEAAA
jgi:hypothetical protein